MDNESLKIAVYTICKNEESFVERWLKYAEKADGIFVNDTGSTDNTVNLLLKSPKVNLIHGKASGENFRFDKAWNEVLDIIPDDYDYCIRLDLDQYFSEENWVPIIKKVIMELKTREKENKTYDEFLGIRLKNPKYKSPEYYWGDETFANNNSSKIRYNGAVHEDYVSSDLLSDRIGASIEKEELHIIHTPPSEVDENANDNKHRLYNKLSRISVIENNTCESILIYLMSIGSELKLEGTSYTRDDLQKEILSFLHGYVNRTPEEIISSELKIKKSHKYVKSHPVLIIILWLILGKFGYTKSYSCFSSLEKSFFILLNSSLPRTSQLTYFTKSLRSFESIFKIPKKDILSCLNFNDISDIQRNNIISHCEQALLNKSL